MADIYWDLWTIGAVSLALASIVMLIVLRAMLIRGITNERGWGQAVHGLFFAGWIGILVFSIHLYNTATADSDAWTFPLFMAPMWAVIICGIVLYERFKRRIMGNDYSIWTQPTEDHLKRARQLWNGRRNGI